MSWDEELARLEQQRRLAKEHGGSDAVARQHEQGRFTIRERIDRLADSGTFLEQGPIAGHPELDDDGGLVSFTPSNYVLGIAEVDGRRCVIGGEDFTQRGGSPTPAGLRKSVYSEQLAYRYRLPLVRFLEGGGGSVTGTGGKGATLGSDPVYAPHRFASIAKVMSTSPVVSAAVGPVAGFPAARLVASHFSVMTMHTSQVMVAGPSVVERALGENTTKEELGGPHVHMRSGVVDRVGEDEDAVVDLIRCFLSYLPTNVWELPPRRQSADDRQRCEDELQAVIPRDRRRTYDIRRLVSLVVDRDSLFELTPEFGPSQITALASLDGRPVGVLANDTCHYAGAMTADGARKVRRFVDLCDTFHLPIVSFVDEPGFMIGADAESAGTIRHGAAALFAVVQSTVPWATVIIRKAYGVAAAAHFGPEGLVLAWPSAETGALPIEGGVAVAFRREIAEASDPDAHRRSLEERFAAGRSPFPRAEAFGVHDLIEPRRTRPVLCDWLDCVEPLLHAHLGPKTYAIRP